MTKIVIIDNKVLFRTGLQGLLNSEGTFDVVAVGNDAYEATTLFENYNPDIILMEINKNCIGATKKLLDVYSEAKVVIFSHDDSQSFAVQAMKAGACGYMLMNTEVEELYKTIKHVAAGGYYIHPDKVKDIVNEFKRLSDLEYKVFVQKEIKLPFHHLTKRECEVLQSLAEGQSNLKIAKSLYISDKTVKNHVSNILSKMKVIDRTQAVVMAIKNGWVVI